ncbi:MAG TPA: hypothetical protein VEN12_02045 [Verrucomicrobiae bacterium]|nr:hypothetical protein [Verrucomicrobiae bacterium]
MDPIRQETEGTTDLARVHGWLSRHRGQTLDLDHAQSLVLGVPISAARAVLVAVALHADGEVVPRLGGVVRAISNRTPGEPVRLVFEGRSPAHLPPSEAEVAASLLLGSISDLVAGDDLVARVA